MCCPTADGLGVCVCDVRRDCSCRWTTTIRLPLKSEMKQLAASRMLTARFHDIQPSLLLFLHRLRSITIYNHVRIHGFTIKPLSYASQVAQQVRSLEMAG